VAKDVTVYNAEGTAQLALEGATDNTMELVLGYNTTADKGFIQAVNWGNNYRDLLLNPNGGNVGIGTNNPNFKLHVSDNGVTAAGMDSETDVLISNTNTAASIGGLAIMSGTGADARIFFGDTDSERRGRLIYSNSDDAFIFGTGGTSEWLRIDSAGKVSAVGDICTDAGGGVCLSTGGGGGGDRVYKTCQQSGTNQAQCTATCPAGYAVVGGGCSSEGSNTGYTYDTISRPTATNDGWLCRVSIDFNMPSDTIVANGYAICENGTGGGGSGNINLTDCHWEGTVVPYVSFINEICPAGEVVAGLVIWNSSAAQIYCCKLEGGGGSGDGNSLDAADGDPVDAVYVDNVGNVGIGKTNPGAKLDVNGTIRATEICNETGTACNDTTCPWGACFRSIV
jgi:hypothetical protein